jgi:peroxiredoxin
MVSIDASKLDSKVGSADSGIMMLYKVRTWIQAGVAALGLLLTQMAWAQFAPSAEAARPLGVGARAPDFVASHADGTPYVFSAGHLQEPHVLIFYRGGWCPYCNQQLADLHVVEPKLRSAGFAVVFLSTDRPALLYSSLKNPDVDYTLLSDPELKAAQAFRIAFHLDDKKYAEELRWGVDLEKSTGTKAHALPVPSVFIVDTSGVIRFAYSNPDFRVRLGAQELWKAAVPLAPNPQVQ